MTLANSAWTEQPISEHDAARSQHEAEKQAQARLAAAWAVAGLAHDLADARLLLDVLGLSREDVAAARQRRRDAA